MGYVAPDSTIRILRDVPLDSTYEHTLYFSSKSTQEEYFTSKTVATFNTYSYVKPEEGGIGSVKVNIGADRLYSANYLMFKNTAFGNKWFYAFITSVEYINNVTTKVSFSIDELQTWLTDFTPEYCLVEREHTATDGYGEHLEDENLYTGIEKFSDFSPIPELKADLSNAKILIYATFDKNFNDGGSNESIASGNVYSGLCYNFFNNSADANKFLSEAYAKNKGDGIVQILMSDNRFSNAENTAIIKKQKGNAFLSKAYNNIDGYVPKNKKLFNYPYNYLYLTNNNGDNLVIRYELCDGENVEYTWITQLNDSPSTSFIARNYNGVSGDNLTEKISLEVFPVCSYNNDFYQAWCAINATPEISNLLFTHGSNFIGGAVQMASGTGGASELTSGLTGMIDSLNTAINVDRHANVAQSPPSKTNIEYSLGRLQIEYSRVTIRREFAEKIDTFFNKYGYICNKIKIPVYTNRPYWNYIKTRGFNVKGNLPVTARNKIASIFDKGVTFWKSPEFVGNYGLDNSPT